MLSCTMLNEVMDQEKQYDWTIYRGSPSLNGFSERKLPESPQMFWSVSAQMRTVASPIVYGGLVYTLDRKGRLRSIAEGGDTTLVHDFGSAVEASFLVQDSVIYVGRIDGYVSAFSIPRKRILWEYETYGQISGSPNLIEADSRKVLLVGSYDNSMYTFDARTGQKLSQFETGYYINGAPAVWNYYMVFGGCDAWLRLVDTQSGVQTDSLELDAYVPASPAILGDMAYVADYNGDVYEVKMADGRFASHRKLVSAPATEGDQQGGVVSMPTVTRDAVYILSDERYIKCLDRKTGQQRWKKMLRGETGESSPLVCSDRVLVCTKDGHISILACADGKELWHYEAGEQIISSPAVVGGRFYVLTARGTLLCFE